MSQMTSKPNPSEFYDENLRATNPILDKFIYTKRRYTFTSFSYVAVFSLLSVSPQRLKLQVTQFYT